MDLTPPQVSAPSVTGVKYCEKIIVFIQEEDAGHRKVGNEALVSILQHHLDKLIIVQLPVAILGEESYL